MHGSGNAAAVHRSISYVQLASKVRLVCGFVRGCTREMLVTTDSNRMPGRLRPGVILMLVLWLATLQTAWSFTLEEFEFDDPERAAEFRELIGELRCTVCQNESLAASQADLAQDMRQRVYQMMREGATREEIVEYVVSRYGDFVLYRPPLRPSTYPLWFGPLLLAIVGLFFLVRTLMRKSRDVEEDLSPDERARLDAMLGKNDTDEAK